MPVRSLLSLKPGELSLFQRFVDTLMVVQMCWLVWDDAATAVVNVHQRSTIVFKHHAGGTGGGGIAPGSVRIPCAAFQPVVKDGGGGGGGDSASIVDIDVDSGELLVCGRAPAVAVSAPAPALLPFERAANFSVPSERFNAVVYVMCLGMDRTAVRCGGGAPATMRTEFDRRPPDPAATGDDDGDDDDRSTILATFGASSCSTDLAEVTVISKSIRRVTSLMSQFKTIRVFVDPLEHTLTLHCKAHNNRCEIISQHDGHH